MALSEADFIVVGGGLTGCALASRLAQKDMHLTVILIEAGKDASHNPQTKDIKGAFSLAGSDLDYNYKTIPQKNTNDRVHSITAGKVLGGGSILNYGGWARGDADDYNQWAKTVNDPRWSYEGMLPYLKRSEKHFQVSESPEHRGSNGPMRVVSVLDSDPKRKYGLREPIQAAWKELGLGEASPGDCGSLNGIHDMLENFHDGQRQPSNIAYTLERVEIVTNAVAHKVLFTTNTAHLPTASAVLLTDGRTFKARKEIILSAGSIKTPQLLMLSGIGPKSLLSRYDIPVVHENEAVGKNYFDHFAHFQIWKLRNPEKGLSMGTPLWNDPAFFKGLPCDWTVDESVPSQISEPAIKRDVKNGKGGDESLLDPTRCHVEIMVVYSPVGAPVPIDGTYVATSVMLLLPTSRGSLNIVSASPQNAPAIDPNYYDTDFDRKTLIYGTRRAAKALLGTVEGKAHIESEGTPPGASAITPESSDEDIDARIRSAGLSHAHSAGTAAMGTVVDSKLCVKGTLGLRVVDSSILPVPIGGHPQATLYGLAEQAADIILPNNVPNQ